MLHRRRRYRIALHTVVTVLAAIFRRAEGQWANNLSYDMPAMSGHSACFHMDMRGRETSRSHLKAKPQGPHSRKLRADACGMRLLHEGLHAEASACGRICIKVNDPS